MFVPANAPHYDFTLFIVFLVRKCFFRCSFLLGARENRRENTDAKNKLLCSIVTERLHWVLFLFFFKCSDFEKLQTDKPNSVGKSLYASVIKLTQKPVRFCTACCAERVQESQMTNSRWSWMSSIRFVTAFPSRNRWKSFGRTWHGIQDRTTNVPVYHYRSIFKGSKVFIIIIIIIVIWKSWNIVL